MAHINDTLIQWQLSKSATLGRGDLASFCTLIQQEYIMHLYESVAMLGAVGNFRSKLTGWYLPGAHNFVGGPRPT